MTRILNYILGAGVIVVTIIALFFVFQNGNLKGEIEKKDIKIERLEINNTALNSQVDTLNAKIEFLDDQDKLEEQARKILEAELEKARNKTVPVEIRTITKIVKEDPIKGEAIIVEGMNNVTEEFEELTSTFSD